MSARYVAVNWNRQKRVYDGLLAFGVALTLAVFTGVTLAAHPTATVETALIRGLGITAFLLLHLILAIGPLARLDSRFLPLLYNRRHLGVTMAILALGHAGFAVFQFHALGDRNPLLSLLTANPDLDSLARFPFELLGLLALVVLALMAATSHDFWLSVLTPPVWKRLHMTAYVAYAALVGHVFLGTLQDQRSAVPAAVFGVGLLLIAGLHLAAALRERPRDRERPGDESWVDLGPAGDIAEGRARMGVVAGERVAVFRHQGRLSCVSNVCRHQNGPLGEGRIIDGCITCPWHGYQYRPDSGASPPPFTDTIPTFNLRVRGGRVEVYRQPNPPGTRVEPVPAEGDAGASQDMPFYVGYQPQAPAAVAGFLRATVVTILFLAGLAAATLAIAQRGFDSAAFEYGRIRVATGVIRSAPYPILEVTRPESDRVSRYLLAGAGKRGAQSVVGPLDGKRVTVRGTLAYRSQVTLLELARVEAVGDEAVHPEAPVEDLGTFDLVGEIVDGKCYAGVMNPGHGKGHRGCAARCLSGGLPALLVVGAESGERLELLLLDGAGRVVRGVERWAGQPLALRGRVERQGDLWRVRADPDSYRRLE